VARPRATGQANGLWLAALVAGLRRQAVDEWLNGPLHRAAIERPRATGWAAQPRDPRPADPALGQSIIEGAIVLAGETLEVGPGGDPFAGASPSRAFALALHRFAWAPALLAAGGAAEALRLALAWERGFGRWNRFAWDAEALERRVFNLACAGQAMAAAGRPADAARLAQSLARQARHLLALPASIVRGADALAAVAVAGCALDGPAGERLRAAALPRLLAALDAAVRPDGAHVTRSPEAGLELLLDLMALEDGLGQRGVPLPPPLAAAIARLSGATEALTLGDGRLPGMQGGEPSRADRVAAARLHERAPADPDAAVGGYARLKGPGLEVIVDAAAPAEGAWSVAACGQPMAIEVLSGRDRLIASTAWSPAAQGPAALRMAAGGSTVTLGLGHVGAPLSGGAARVLGARLVGGITRLAAARRENDAGIWLDMAHDGWRATTGLTHERRLFIDKGAGELRGEDRFVPSESPRAGASLPVAIWFHLHPDVDASLARDARSVLLRGPSAIGWWLRNDAGEVHLEASVHHEDGRPRRTRAVVMRGRLRTDRGGRIRWKLTLAEPPR